MAEANDDEGEPEIDEAELNLDKVRVPRKKPLRLKKEGFQMFFFAFACFFRLKKIWLPSTLKKRRMKSYISMI